MYTLFGMAVCLGMESMTEIYQHVDNSSLMQTLKKLNSASV